MRYTISDFHWVFHPPYTHHVLTHPTHTSHTPHTPHTSYTHLTHPTHTHTHTHPDTLIKNSSLCCSHTWVQSSSSLQNSGWRSLRMSRCLWNQHMFGRPLDPTSIVIELMCILPSMFRQSGHGPLSLWLLHMSNTIQDHLPSSTSMNVDLEDHYSF